MPNSYDTDPRGSNDRKLVTLGVCFTLVALLTAAVMVAKSRGLLDEFVRVDISLTNIGDGLPARSDVKFRGVLVGTVSEVTPSQNGLPNIVHVDIDPQHAQRIPGTITARVVPSNIFAVSAVQLVDNGPSPHPLRDGSTIAEDQTLPTVLFQNVLAKLRELLAAVGEHPDDNTIGVISALAQATHGRGQTLTRAGRQLNDVMTQLNSIINRDDSGSTTLTALQAGADTLRSASPELFNALAAAVEPMRTIAEHRGQLTSFLSGGLNTTSTLGDAFDHQSDRMIAISTELTPVLGVLADNADQFPATSTRLQNFANRFYDEAWNPDTNQITIRAIVGFAPTRTYVRADCPRYGEMQGPSCQTAPEIPTAPALMPSLATLGIPPPNGVSENRPNLAPPRDSVRGAGPAPGPVPDAPPPAPATDVPPAPSGAPSTAPLPAESPLPVQPQSESFGGNVGPVGSDTEKRRLRMITGASVPSATEVLLGPLARGTTVHILTEDGAAR